MTGMHGGLTANISARIIWGVAALYINAAAASNSLRLFEQRVFWAFVLMLLVAIGCGEMTEIRRVISDHAALAITAVCAFLIATNWYTVIWCTKNGQLMVAGIGFFFAPLFMVLSGALLFREERISNLAPSFACCFAGIFVYFSGNLTFPWPVILIATSTTAYAMLRKSFPLPTFTANVLESGITLIVTSIILISLYGLTSLLPPSEDHWLYYPGLGVMTGVPMLLYVFSLPYVPMMLIGYLQYITPTIMMAVSLTIGERVGWVQIAGLCLIWLAVAFYLLRQKKQLA